MPVRIGNLVDIFQITITGRGGHAALPNHCIDPMLAASHIHLALRSIMSHAIDPLQEAFVSATQIHGGATDNAIPQ